MSNELKENNELVTDVMSTLQDYLFSQDRLLTESIGNILLKGLLSDRRELQKWKSKYISIEDNEVYVQTLVNQLSVCKEALLLLNKVSSEDMLQEQLTNSHFILDVTSDALEKLESL